MFIPTFEDLRIWLYNSNLINMAHLGARAFEDIGGEVVQTTAFVLCKNSTKNYRGSYVKLTDFGSQDLKEKAFLQKKDCLTYHIVKEKYLNVPSNIYVYWINDAIFNAFLQSKISDKLEQKQV